MKHERAMELLNQIVEHEHVARNNKEAIQELVRMGFTETELIDDFHHSALDVMDAVDDM